MVEVREYRVWATLRLPPPGPCSGAAGVQADGCAFLNMGRSKNRIPIKIAGQAGGDCLNMGFLDVPAWGSAPENNWRNGRNSKARAKPWGKPLWTADPGLFRGGKGVFRLDSED